MTTSERCRAVIVAALAFGMASIAPVRAAGWEMREFETPDGEKGVALAVVAKRHPDVRLAIGCDGVTGTRWRGVAVVEEPDSRAGLGMRGDVRIGFGGATSRDLWQVRTTAAERRIFMAAEPTRLGRRLLREEAAAPAGEVTIEIHGVGGKPVPVTFPLAGLRAKVGAIAKRCADWELEEQ